MWEASKSGDPNLNGARVLRWDELIEGVRWYRDGPFGADFVYMLEIEDAAAAGAKTEIDLRDFASSGSGRWERASYWANRENFPAVDIFWREGLTLEQAAPSAVVVDHLDAIPESEPGSAPDSAPESEPEPDLEPKHHSEEVIPPVVAPGGQGDVGQRLGNPTITSEGAAEYAPQGAYAWTVSMAVAVTRPHQTWLIQRLHITNDEVRTTFWEAFPVNADETQAADKDVFQRVPHEDDGKVSIRAVMQHHDFNGGAPPGMRIGGSRYCDGEQTASDQPPPFWQADDGTQHDLDFSWGKHGGLFGVKLTTVPASGTPVKKDSWRNLDHG